MSNLMYIAAIWAAYLCMRDRRGAEINTVLDAALYFVVRFLITLGILILAYAVIVNINPDFNFDFSLEIKTPEK